jgi:hypothetical protein
VPLGQFDIQTFVEATHGAQQATRDANDLIEERQERYDRLRRGAISEDDCRAAERAVFAEMRAGWDPRLAIKRAIDGDVTLWQAISPRNDRAPVREGTSAWQAVGRRGGRDDRARSCCQHMARGRPAKALKRTISTETWAGAFAGTRRPEWPPSQEERRRRRRPQAQSTSRRP